MAAALVSFYMKIPVAHIEAGLRSFDKWSPFPEEFNREIIDTFADYYFAPTKVSCWNLIQERHTNRSNIYITGNTGIDALMMIRQIDPTPSMLALDKKLKLKDDSKRRVLLTTHRRENFNELQNIFDAINVILRKYDDIEIIFPAHLNPNVRKQIYLLDSEDESKLVIMDPLPYDELLYLMKHVYMVITDSGGLQEEASSLGKPVLLLRVNTERPEGIMAGVVKLVGTNKENIIENVEQLFNNQTQYKLMSEIKYPFGDGHASKRIVDVILKGRTEEFDSLGSCDPPPKETITDDNNYYYYHRNPKLNYDQYEKFPNIEGDVDVNGNVDYYETDEISLPFVEEPTDESIDRDHPTDVPTSSVELTSDDSDSDESNSEHDSWLDELNDNDATTTTGNTTEDEEDDEVDEVNVDEEDEDEDDVEVVEDEEGADKEEVENKHKDNNIHVLPVLHPFNEVKNDIPLEGIAYDDILSIVGSHDVAFVDRSVSYIVSCKFINMIDIAIGSILRQSDVVVESIHLITYFENESDEMEKFNRLRSKFTDPRITVVNRDPSNAKYSEIISLHEGIQLNSKYVAILSDDIIPEEKYSSLLVSMMESGMEGLYGSSGLILPPFDTHSVKTGRHLTDVKRVNQSMSLNQVDVVSGFMFMKTSWLQICMRETFPVHSIQENLDGFFLSYLMTKYVGVKKYVTPFNKKDHKTQLVYVRDDSTTKYNTRKSNPKPSPTSTPVSSPKSSPKLSTIQRPYVDDDFGFVPTEDDYIYFYTPDTKQTTTTDPSDTTEQTMTTTYDSSNTNEETSNSSESTNTEETTFDKPEYNNTTDDNNTSTTTTTPSNPEIIDENITQTNIDNTIDENKTTNKSTNKTDHETEDKVDEVNEEVDDGDEVVKDTVEDEVSEGVTESQAKFEDKEEVEETKYTIFDKVVNGAKQQQGQGQGQGQRQGQRQGERQGQLRIQPEEEETSRYYHKVQDKRHPVVVKPKNALTRKSHSPEQKRK
eukprot:TRINITY_DN3064_c0_g2_i1.p1 TRINITY_DN3064_c0_g2~~TRINITY_DN3064_c0_g2_i1.p1  ORF type:complete len:1147 (-),score=368.56 TRINITY_DN3064_c0_g2_i1:3741-6713(-)